LRSTVFASSEVTGVIAKVALISPTLSKAADSDTAIGMSATNVRDAARKGDYESFKAGLARDTDNKPLSDEITRTLFNAINSTTGVVRKPRTNKPETFKEFVKYSY